MIDPLALAALVERCAPDAPAGVLAAIVQVESGGRPLAVNVNRGAPLRAQPASRPEAEALARARLARGENLDLGLAQINSANFGWLGLDAGSVFDPCRNLAAAARVLDAGLTGAEPRTLRAALSRYNTGSPTRGLRNGYVARVERALRRLEAGRVDGATAPPPAAPTPPAPPAWDVFARSALSLQLGDE